MSDIDLHRTICDEIHNKYIEKDADYGSSFRQLYAEFGLLSSVIRMSDKLNRVKSLLSKEAQVKDESIDDTLLDLAGYAILTLVERRRDTESSGHYVYHCKNYNTDTYEPYYKYDDTGTTRVCPLCMAADPNKIPAK